MVNAACCDASGGLGEVEALGVADVERHRHSQHRDVLAVAEMLFVEQLLLSP
jgi:hypothetical protein